MLLLKSSDRVQEDLNRLLKTVRKDVDESGY
jgi:hypothetical protein